MTNRYDIQGIDQEPRPAPSPSPRGEILRPALWALLVVSAAANMVTSSAGLNVLVGIACGLLTLGCITALVVNHYARRNR